ncbi:MAG: SEC-C metal-binding domain-containing protein [Methanosarcina mazei]
MSKIGRNELCPCGSGKKYKKCCIGKKQTEEETVKPLKTQMTTNKVPIFGTNIGISKEQFDTKEEILNDIRKRGFYPGIIDETDYDEEWDLPPSIEIGLVCKHGWSEESETYELKVNGKWECTEGGGGIEFCWFCDEGITPICQNCKTPLPELDEKQILELWHSENHLFDLKCPKCGKSS